jgi:hypothetical protein
MTNQVAQFVQASRNFSFLIQPALVLGGDLAAAEAYVYSDPDAAMGKARRFSETLAKMVLRQAGLPTPQNQSQRVRDLFAAGLIDARLRGLFDLIRHAGNMAVHDHSGDAQKALEVVEVCFELSAWWYRRETGTAVSHAFSPPVRVPTTEEKLLSQLQGLEAQLTGMQMAMEEGFAATGVRDPQPWIAIHSNTPDPLVWRGGSEVVCDSTTYLVHDPVESVTATDGSGTMMEADAHTLDSTARPVRLRAIRTDRPGRSAEELTRGLKAQAAFLDTRRPRRGMPTLVSQQHAGRLHTLVTAAPQAVTWRKMFGDGREPVDPLVLPAALDVVIAVANGLAELHRAGQGHRAVGATSVLVTTAGRRGLLRDLGCAWWPSMSELSLDYIAPEQVSMARGVPGPPTDVFQLAALLQHTCTGIRPGAGRAVPLRTFFPGVPVNLDELLERSLDPDPSRRPGMAALAAGVRHSGGQLQSEAMA